MSYTCQNCGVQEENALNLCSATKEGPEDNFCGIPEEWICESMLSQMKYSCESCGSVSANPDNLCRPSEIREEIESSLTHSK